jgi:hypothetical protein
MHRVLYSYKLRLAMTRFETFNNVDKPLQVDDNHFTFVMWMLRVLWVLMLK